ncbi:MAG TPA: hypothetical protein VJ835_02645 [Fimbriimonadaceae bacterium]|nr:hypothetical protein [Fimbriimonadaceae bacterium]
MAELAKENGFASLSEAWDGGPVLDSSIHRFPLDPGKWKWIAAKVRDVVHDCPVVAVQISDMDIWGCSSESVEAIFAKGLGVNPKQLYEPMFITGADRQVIDAIGLYCFLGLRDLLILPDGLGYSIELSHDEFIDLHGHKELFADMSRWLTEFLASERT